MANDVLSRLGKEHLGEVATYIPTLGGMPPDLFGLARVTTDRGVTEACDPRHEFTTQSVSKPSLYAMA